MGYTQPPLKIEEDASAYVAILNGPANGLGQHVCPKTGRQSHVVLHARSAEHGAEAFNAAVLAAFKKSA
jgi:hypothetical protein